MENSNPKGAGVKKGSVRPKLTDYWSQDDINDYFTWLKANYALNPALAKFVGEQLMGKAVQPIGNEDDKPFKVDVSGMSIVDDDSSI